MNEYIGLDGLCCITPVVHEGMITCNYYAIRMVFIPSSGQNFLMAAIVCKA